jgi:hypothetical protein
MTDPTKSVSTSILITPAAPTLAKGTYVFQLSGHAGPAASLITGVIAITGAIIDGELDVANFGTDSNDDLVSCNQLSKITGGSYVTTPDGDPQISINVAHVQHGNPKRRPLFARTRIRRQSLWLGGQWHPRRADHNGSAFWWDTPSPSMAGISTARQLGPGCPQRR